METRWLEDLVTLADTRSFRKSAQLRHVTQPAFSRRIRALEDWAGAQLVDRSAHPMRLTRAGKTLSERAVELLQSLRAVQALTRGNAGGGDDTVQFAAPPALACAFLPRWLASLSADLPRVRTSVATMSVHEAMQALVENRCELMIAYHHDCHPLPLDPQQYDTVEIGADLLLPYVRADAQGQPRYRLPGTPGRCMPYLGYKPGAYLGGVMDHVLARMQPAPQLDRIYEADMADCLKAMALEGHGIAFLPQAAVVAEVRSRRLVEAGDFPGQFAVPLSIRAYRVKPVGTRRHARAAEFLWAALLARQGLHGAR